MRGAFLCERYVRIGRPPKLFAASGMFCVNGMCFLFEILEHKSIVMIWIVGIIIAVGIVFFLTMRSGGNLKFWKAVAKNPQMAMEFFEDNPEVFAIEGITHDAIDRSYYDVGPFYFSFMGKNLKIYAHRADLEAKEEEFQRMC